MPERLQPLPLAALRLADAVETARHAFCSEVKSVCPIPHKPSLLPQATVLVCELLFRRDGFLHFPSGSQLPDLRRYKHAYVAVGCERQRGRTTRAVVLEMLERTPRRIASATRRLSNSESNWKSAADSWSVNESPGAPPLLLGPVGWEHTEDPATGSTHVPIRFTPRVDQEDQLLGQP